MMGWWARGTPLRESLEDLRMMELPLPSSSLVLTYWHKHLESSPSRSEPGGYEENGSKPAEGFQARL